MRRHHLALPLILGALSLATPARAVEPRDAAAAEVLFRRAKELLAKGEIHEACASFSESLRLDPATGTLLNLAACEEREGKLASAWQHFVDARAGLPAGDFRIAFADKRIEALEPRVPKLTLTLGEPSKDARVFRDDVELGAPSLGVAIPTDPGRHVISVRAVGRAETSVVVVLAEAEQKAVGLELGSPTPIEERAGAPNEPPATTQRTLGYVVGGAGALALTVGIVSAFITVDAASRYKKNCHDGACSAQGLDAASTGRTFEVVSPIAIGAGVVALGVGAYLVLAAPKRKGNAAIVAPFFAF